jgi:hypothetical protein
MFFQHTNEMFQIMEIEIYVELVHDVQVHKYYKKSKLLSFNNNQNPTEVAYQHPLIEENYRQKQANRSLYKRHESI